MRAVASSSPSVKKIPSETPVSVTEIRPHASIAAGVSVFVRLPDNDTHDSYGPHRRRPLVRFDISRDLLSRSGEVLEDSTTTTLGRLRTLSLESGHLFAPAVAVDLLSRRDHSEAELRRKLAFRGFDASAIAHALQRVQQRDYQSDQRFAASWIRSRMGGSGVSRNSLLAGLARRGVDRETAARAVTRYEEDNPECFSRALSAALRTIETDDSATKMRKLLRRGFDVVEIRRILA